MEKTANSEWQKIANKGQQVVIQNQGSFDIKVRVEQEDNSHGSEDSGWILHPNSEPTPLQNGAVWIRSASGLQSAVFYEINKKD